MALLFLDGFDKYGPANSNSTAVVALLTAGEWTTASTTACTIVAPLSATGQAITCSVPNLTAIAKTFAGNYTRLIGGFRFSWSVVGAAAGFSFRDAGSNQCSLTFDPAGTFSLRTGNTTGTAIATSTASVSANTTHYLEFDITFSNTGAYQVWLDGVSILSGTGDTTNSANNFANGFAFNCQNASGATFTIDDLYLFDTTGTTNNAVLLTSPRIETQFPSGDSTVQFSIGAAVVGTSTARTTASVSTATNILRLRPITPAVNCTIASVSFLPAASNGSIQLRPVVYTDSAGAPNTLMSAGSTSTGMTSGTNKTLPLTTPQALTAGTPYWVGIMYDISVSAGLAGLDGSNSDRTATSTFASGAPSTAPATSASGSTVIWGNVTVTGANWNEAAQNPPQGSLSYVYEATVGEEDLYTYPALSAPPSAIYAVAVKASVAKSDAGAKTVSVRMKSGSTDSAGTGGTQAPGTSYGWLTSHYPTDPATSAAWTLSALNAAQSGVKVET